MESIRKNGNDDQPHIEFLNYRRPVTGECVHNLSRDAGVAVEDYKPLPERYDSGIKLFNLNYLISQLPSAVCCACHTSCAKMHYPVLQKAEVLHVWIEWAGVGGIF